MKLRELFEAPATAVMAFGRMNPPTIGHAKLVDAIKSQPGDPFIFLSQSQKPKTDPLSFEDKLRYAKFFFPNITIGNPEVKTIIQALQKVESLGYQQLIYVAGSDRLQSFEELLNKYNGKDYTFKSIKVVSAGERDPDADGAEGMSASKLKKLAAEGKLEDWTDENGKKQPGFRSGVPRPEIADEMFAAVRQGMGITEGKSPHKKGTKKYKKHMAAMHAENVEEAEVTPGQTLPKQIKPTKMPTPPQAPTGPDGTGEDGTRIGTTPKGNRSVSSGAGTYIFTPKGKLMLYMTPKIGGLQQTHNPIKQTITVNFDTDVDADGNKVVVGQKGTYDMSGKLISGDATSMKSGSMGISVDKDKGTTVDMTTLSGKKHSLNNKDPKKYDKLAALKKDQDQDLSDFKKANTATLNKMGIKR